MKRLWQGNFQSAIGGLSDSAARYVKENSAALLAYSAQASDDTKQAQFLRLPLESARRLRWYDRSELNELVKLHVRERKELLEVNDALRQVLVDSGIPRAKVDAELMHKIRIVDGVRAAEDGVQSVLLIAAQAELEALGTKCNEQAAELASHRQSSGGRADVETVAASNVQGHVTVSLSVDKDHQENQHISVNLQVSETSKSGSEPRKVDLTELDTLSRAVVQALERHESTVQARVPAGDTSPDEGMDISHVCSQLQDFKHQLAGLLATLQSNRDLTQQLEAAREENARLSEVSSSRQREVHSSGGQNRGEVLAKAQAMTDHYASQSQLANRRAQLSEVRAAKAEQSEKETRQELDRLRGRLREVEALQKSWEEHEKAQWEQQQVDLEASVAAAKQQNAELLDELNIAQAQVVELSAEVAKARSGLSEREILLQHVASLEECLADYKCAAQQCSHYKQVVQELENSAARADAQLVSTARVVTGLEKKLEDANKQLQKAEGRADAAEQRARKLKEKLKGGDSSPGPGSPGLNRTGWQGGVQQEMSKLEGQLEASRSRLEAAKSQLDEEQQQRKAMAAEKEALQVKAEQLEARVGTLERQRASAASQHRHQLSESEERLAESKALAAELERECQALMLKLSSKASAESGGRGPKGGGGFHNLPGESPKTGNGMGREGLSGIDQVYLKNVFLKFIEATARNRVEERDALLPAVATLLEASPQEYNALRLALAAAAPPKNALFSGWLSGGKG